MLPGTTGESASGEPFFVCRAECALPAVIRRGKQRRSRGPEPLERLFGPQVELDGAIRPSGTNSFYTDFPEHAPVFALKGREESSPGQRPGKQERDVHPS